MKRAFKQRVTSALAERAAQGLTRKLVPLARQSGAQFVHQGQTYLHFSSNDYLGLATDPALITAWQEGLSRYGCGSGASPLVTGFHQTHQTLETLLCEWLGYERAILFNSGFSANQAVLFTLLQQDDLLLQDRLNHASLMEAGMLSAATMKRFRHNDAAHLSALLSADQTNMVVTEGVFSMDGDCAPLVALSDCVRHRAVFMVDDAHGIGVLGPDGSGSCAAVGIHPDLLVVTFGKAFGLSGAAVLCDRDVGDYLTQFARHHVYSTAIPPAQAYALSRAIEMIQREQWRRDKLQLLQGIYQERLGHVATALSQTPIQPLIIGSSERTLRVATALREQGIWVSAIRPPTVPQGTARLRVTLTAGHSEAQVRQLAMTLRQVMERHGES
ncbi:8-amino-7-oxononanoate synthase [Vibrio rhizosphaerae]|uniref:8-amino-7-oxononanoate synthase n=1 Tax=Vibrio rhizosphaerae TaxID=398736 RepID=A0ABU4IUZ0_9VIBR|nr:8-amino-7-oxononanoate synthase [Vibrio rhizosphaerae]MDW6093226.1 8-amino-7-oxononanoate synthase [Vibrio rhizosphaerae]